MSIRIKELMETLSQAQEAQDAVPAMKAELARLSRALEASQSEANRYKRASEDIGVELADTKAKSSDLGRERDEAQFRTLELEDKLATISKALSSTLGLVEPEKAREVKAEVKEELAQAPTAQAHDNPVQLAPQAKITREDWAWPGEPAKSHDEERHAPAPEVASQPSPTEDDAWKHPTEEGTGIGYTPAYPVDQAPSTQEGASSTPTPEVNPAPRPAYQGVRWQDKPGYMSWDNFITQGGEKPYWMQ